MDEKLLIVFEENYEKLCLLNHLEQAGFRYIQVSTEPEATACLRENEISILILSGAFLNDPSFLSKISSQQPGVRVIVVTTVNETDRMIQLSEGCVSDILETPISAARLEFALKKAHESIELQDRAETAENKLESLLAKTPGTSVDTERFVAVRQIVDIMSRFIAKTADEVEGGVKYFNEMPYFVSIHDRDMNVLAVNPFYKKHFGSKPRRKSWEIYTGIGAAGDNCPVSKTLKSNTVRISHETVRYRTGSLVPVIVHTAPIFNNDGEVTLIMEVFAGTKEIDSLSKEIGYTQQRYQQLFDAVPCYIAVLNRKMWISAVNQAYKTAFGDHTGRNFQDVFAQGRAPMERSPIAHTINDGEPHQSEMLLTTPRGEPYNMLAWTSPIKTKAGKLVQVLVIFVDITALVKLQDHLSSLGLMLGTLSHSLKGSLTGLDAGLYLIDSGFYRDKPAKIEEGIDVTRLMAERIRKMVFDVLYYAKDRQLAPEEVDVRSFAEDIAAGVDIKIRGANIKFLTDFPKNPGKFEIDVSLFRSALINILDNAREACVEDKRPMEFVISFTVRDEPDYIELEISDNGPGMERTVRDRMFELFYSSKGHKGTGLGMFITNEVVKKHGGSLSVISQPNEGAKFRIRMPRKLTGIARQ